MTNHQLSIVVLLPLSWLSAPGADVLKVDVEAPVSFNASAILRGFEESCQTIRSHNRSQYDANSELKERYCPSYTRTPDSKGQDITQATLLLQTPKSIIYFRLGNNWHSAGFAKTQAKYNLVQCAIKLLEDHHDVNLYQQTRAPFSNPR